MNKVSFDMWCLRRQPFTIQEKSNSIRTIEVIEEISQEIRKNGFSSKSVAKQIQKSENLLLMKGMRLAAQNYEIEIINDIITDYVVACDYKGLYLLQAYLTFLGLQGLIEGENPGSLGNRLYNYLGEDYAESRV